MNNKPTEQELWAILERQVEDGDFDRNTQDDEPPLSSDPDFVFETLRTDLAEAMLRGMEEAGLNENQLAKKLGVSRQAVDEVLNMTTNMTLKSLAKFCAALDRLPVPTLLAPGVQFAGGGSAQKERATDKHR